MKKIFTQCSLILVSLAANYSQAQVSVETFDTYTLSPNSFYKNTSIDNWETPSATFHYSWNSAFDYWESGSAYTNVYDTLDGTFTNLYGCIPGDAFSGSNYVTAQGGAKVTLKNLSILSGFYVTNTTYAWKVIKKGNAFSRKFGDTTGTFSGGIYAQGHYPDWFKIVVRGYRSGNLLTDSVEFYLADYRATGTTNDYVVKNWQFVNCTSLGIVDSVFLYLKSSDVGSFGMNTPSFFSLDNFTTNSTVGISESGLISEASIFPNPAKDYINLQFHAQQSQVLKLNISDVTGRIVKSIEYHSLAGENTVNIDLSELQSGIYFINDNQSLIHTIKFIKH
jgi:hypothetical protein